jgi:hypothetical protein
VPLTSTTMMNLIANEPFTSTATSITTAQALVVPEPSTFVQVAVVGLVVLYNARRRQKPTEFGLVGRASEDRA